MADGISRTGALDWYMGKLLGRPASTASAQLRLMVPIAIVSAFLNNTPVVAVMIPIVQRWGKNIGVSPQQLLIPLSFASILGGTCTLIGTSTNLVVEGLLKSRYPNDTTVSIGLFSLGEYGVPIAIVGMTYILLTSPILIPGGSSSNNNNESNNNKRRRNHNNDFFDGIDPLNAEEEILLGARLTPWSPAATRSVKRSGLRDTGGIYLVSVHRAATGNVHRAVGQEFVLNVGDILYFTGLVEGFGQFCEEHGLEVVTNELETTTSPPLQPQPTESTTVTSTIPTTPQEEEKENEHNNINNGNSADYTELPSEIAPSISIVRQNEPLSAVPEGADFVFEDGIPCEVGVTKESLIWADEAERTRSIAQMTGKF